MWLRTHRARCKAENTPGEEMITEALSWLEALEGALTLLARAEATASRFQAVALERTAIAATAQADSSRLTGELIAARDKIEAARQLLGQ